MAEIDPEQFRALGHAVIDWVADHRTGLAGRPVRPPVEPGDVRAALPRLLPDTGRPLDELLATLDEVVVPGSTLWQHPGFMAYFPANASLHSLLGDLLSGGLGSQGMLWSTSPAATEVEQALLDELAVALGLPAAFTFAGGGGGSIQDSASSAALVALLAALHRTSGGGWRETGVDGRERVYLTAETHSSMAKAVRVAGLGDRAVVVVDGAPHAMSPPALRAALDADVAAGLRPVLVCPTIGTTGTGAVDPVRDVAGVAREFGAWTHVDAAWAGVAALCPEHRELLDGVELVDSFCTDAHKWLLTAFDASMLWVRDAAALPAALSITPEFLRDGRTGVVDYRDWQVPLGRRFRALKLWAVLHGHGLDGLREHLRGHVTLAVELESWLAGQSHLVQAAPRTLALVCLRHRDGDDATRALLERVNASGRVLLSHTVVDGRYTIRVAIGGVTTGRADLEALQDLLAPA